MPQRIEFSRPDPNAARWPAPQVLAQAFFVAGDRLRARVLVRLMGSVGTLALAVLGGGAFSKFLRARPVSIEDAAGVTIDQFLELASYVQQSNPSAVIQVLDLLSRDASTMSALGASVAAVVIGIVYRQTAKQRRT